MEYLLTILYVVIHTPADFMCQCPIGRFVSFFVGPRGRIIFFEKFTKSFRDSFAANFPISHSISSTV
jgi:hypothetical protein